MVAATDCTGCALSGPSVVVSPEVLGFPDSPPRSPEVIATAVKTTPHQDAVDHHAARQSIGT